MANIRPPAVNLDDLYESACRNGRCITLSTADYAGRCGFMALTYPAAPDVAARALLRASYPGAVVYCETCSMLTEVEPCPCLTCSRRLAAVGDQLGRVA